MLYIKNNARSTLAAGISATDTSLTVATGEGSKFPSLTPFRITIDNEIIEVGAVSGDTFSSLTRGVEGTTAAAHSSGAVVELRITAELVDQWRFTGINTQTGTSYTLVLSDASKLVQMNNASANTLTIPANSSVPFPIGTKIAIQKYGAGNTTIQAATGVSLRDPNSGATISTQYDLRVIMKIGTNEWVLL